MLLLLQVHVVTAFERSLSNMTQRLQKLAAASELKVSLSGYMQQSVLALAYREPFYSGRLVFFSLLY